MTRLINQAKINNINVTTGYDFLNKEFFVTNKGTRTTRLTNDLIKEVLDIVAPNNTVTTTDYTTLQETDETVQALSYTLEDTGAYVQTIQINDYSNYPITLDADKHKLYIMNTDLVFDLALNERNTERVQTLCSYFLNKFGINVSNYDMLAIYEFLIGLYKPNPYNLINTEIQTPLTYSNTFNLSNYTNKARATYTCTENPNQVFSPTTVQADTYNVLATNSNNNTITLTANTTLPINTAFYLEGTTLETESYTNTADGIYTVKETSNNIITTNESIPYTYTFKYPTIHLISSQLNIQAISRDNCTITCSSNIPNSLIVGDIIYVQGTQQYIEHETLTCDGSYTVASIDTANKVITVQEQPLTNYTYSTGTVPTLSKHLFIGNVASINATQKKISMTENMSTIPTNNSKIILTNNNTYTVLTVTNTTVVTITVSESVQAYSPVYPTVKKQVPNPNILINILTTTNQSQFPTGEFLVDNFADCQSYLNTFLDADHVPTSTTKNNINNPVPTTCVIPDTTLPTMHLLGLYSQVYNNKTT